MNGVRRLKLAVTSSCGLRCTYCPIDKERGEEMTLAAAAVVLRRAIASPGKRKSVGIYGGEPMSRFKLVAGIVRLARKLERAHGKLVDLTVATNGLLLKPRHLDFFRANAVSLHISIDGAGNDRYRVYRDGSGSLGDLLRVLPTVFARMPAGSVTALQGVHPTQAAKTQAEFRWLAARGFENVNLELIQGPAWDAAARRRLGSQLRGIGRDLERAAREGRRLFLQSVNRGLAAKDEGGATWEMYPDGRVAALPYPFLHPSDDGAPMDMDDGRRAIELREDFSRRFAKRLGALASKTAPVARYVAQARERAA